MKIFAVHPAFQMASFDRYCLGCEFNMNVYSKSDIFGYWALCNGQTCGNSVYDSKEVLLKIGPQHQEVYFRRLKGFFGVDMETIKARISVGLKRNPAEG